MLTYYDTENFWANDLPMTGSNPFLGSMCEKYLDKSLRDDKNMAFSHQTSWFLNMIKISLETKWPRLM